MEREELKSVRRNALREHERRGIPEIECLGCMGPSRCDVCEREDLCGCGIWDLPEDEVLPLVESTDLLICCECRAAVLRLRADGLPEEQEVRASQTHLMKALAMEPGTVFEGGPHFGSAKLQALAAAATADIERLLQVVRKASCCSPSPLTR